MDSVIIACATDENYAEYAGVLLRSIAVNGDADTAEVVVFADDLSPRTKTMIAEAGSGLNIRIADLSEDMRHRMAGLPAYLYWTKTAFVRLFLPELLPDAEKVLFLDVDIVVNHSLRPLLEMPLEGAVLAAAPNYGDADTIAWLNRSVGRAATQPNINAGVLLIDLRQWRDRDLTDRCLEFLKWTPRTVYIEQDAINAVIGDDVKILDRSWNFFSVRPRVFTQDDYAAANVIHFVTSTKPNLVECAHPAKAIYLALRAQTPWRDTPLMTRQPRGIRRLITNLLRRIYPKPPAMRPAGRRDVERAQQRLES